MEFDDGRSVNLRQDMDNRQTTESCLSDPISCHQPTSYGGSDPLIHEDWITDVAAIHPASGNWICFAMSDGAGGWTHKWCRGNDVLCTLQRLKASPDFQKRNIYVSQLEFAERKRTVNAVAEMNVSFLDLDGKLAKNQTPEEWREVVLEHCRRYAIPEPNDMVFTGNGIHVKWIYTQPTSKSRLERWNLIERLLFVQFEELGADAKSLDAARVLRVPGTFNCKPWTADNRVRVVHHSPAVYTFEEFAAKVEASIPVNEESFKTCLAEFEKSRRTAEPEPELPECQNSEAELNRAEEDWLLNTLVQHNPRDTWVNLSCEALGGQSHWLQTYELHDTLKRLDFNQGWRLALAEFNEKSRVENRLAVAYIPCNFVVLPRCPGVTVEERAENIKQHCREYRDVGIPEPNQFLTIGDTIIAEWSYDKVLPGRAVSRWNRTQEFLCRHFECWGAMDDPDNLKATAYLPIPGFKGEDGETVRLAYSAPEIRYSFDSLARAVLNFSQQAVKEYKAEKAEEKARKHMERKPRFLGGNGDFSRIALRRYHDISHLLEMRKDGLGNTRQGCREKCLFWAMNFAIQAGEVTPLNFDTYAQSLIDFCGPRFRSECGVRVLTTLKRKLEKGEKTYHATDRKLIKELGITEEEQREMLTLKADKSPKAKKERTPRPKWLEAHPQERTAPWTKKGISRSKFFKDRKAAREAAEKERLWRAAQRRMAEQWIKARQGQYNRTKQRWGLNNTPLRGQVLPHIMMRALGGGMTKYRYRVKRKRERGP